MVIVNRQELTRALERCARVSLTKSPLEALSHVLIECDDALDYRATDLKVEVSGRIAAKGEASFTAKPRDLLNALSVLSGEMVKLEPGAGFVKLTGDTKRSFKVQTLEAADYPAEIEVGGEQFEVEGSLIGNLMSMVVHAASEDEARQNQKRVFVAKRAKDSAAMATDGHRMAICTIEPALPFDLDVSLTLARELADLDAGPVKLSTDDRGIAYERGGERTIALAQAGQFPNVSHVLEGLTPTRQAKLSAESLLETVKAVQRIDSGSEICLTFSKGGVVVECTGEGSARDELDCECSGDGQLWFEGLYLVDALSVVKGEVTLRFGATLEPLIIEQANWKAIVMPMHPDHAMSKGK